jgi:hypothetical protein
LIDRSLEFETRMSNPAHDPTATVVPLDADLADRDPWQLLASGQGMLVSWSNERPPEGRPWGAPLRATSTLAKQIRQIADQVVGTDVVEHGRRLYRLELPAGFGADALMPAVGGGLRATVTKSGSSVIAGQGKLVPLASKGRLLAAGPALGLMALTIVAEIAAGDVQEAKLTAILEGVERIDARLEMESEARLVTADQTIRQAHAAILDGASIPESIGLGTAMGHLQVVRNMSTTLLTGWERVVAELPNGPVEGADLRKDLGRPGAVGWDGFAAAVRTAYVAITIDARRVMLTAAEAQLRNPGLPLTAFRESVESDLAARTAELDRLRAVVSRLSTVPLSVSSWSAGVLPHLVSDAAAENSRTQALFATLTAVLSRSQRSAAVPTVDGRITVEAEVRPGGEIQLLRHDPAAQIPA